MGKHRTEKLREEGEGDGGEVRAMTRGGVVVPVSGDWCVPCSRCGEHCGIARELSEETPGGV